MWERLEESLQRYEDLERQMSDPAVAANPERFTATAKEHGSLARYALRYRKYQELAKQIADAEEMLDDLDMKDMAEEELAHLKPERDAVKNELIDLLLSGPEADHGSLILEIRAGTGGEEAALFARDLFEMYRRYAELRNWKVEVLDHHTSDQRGFKEVVCSISGEDAYRELQYESGGHRVQRVPTTEAQGRIHTSAATVAVMAEPEDVDVEIRDEDLEMEAIRSSGPGGQHVNKTSSAVRLTHVPTGLVVLCQDERSQHKNRARAMRLLKSRLYDMKLQQSRRERAETRRSLIGSGDRSERIRTYNFPQNRCTDHRIGANFNLEQIVAGDLRKLVSTLRDYDREQRLGSMEGDL